MCKMEMLFVKSTIKQVWDLFHQLQIYSRPNRDILQHQEYLMPSVVIETDKCIYLQGRFSSLIVHM